MCSHAPPGPSPQGEGTDGPARDLQRYGVGVVQRCQVQDDLLQHPGEGVGGLVLLVEIDHAAVVPAHVHAGVGGVGFFTAFAGAHLFSGAASLTVLGIALWLTADKSRGTSTRKVETPKACCETASGPPSVRSSDCSQPPSTLTPQPVSFVLMRRPTPAASGRR